MHTSRSSRHLETPVTKKVEADLGRSLVQRQSLGASPIASGAAGTRLDRRLRAVQSIDPVLQLQPQILLERATIDEAQSCAQSQEPPAPQLLAQHCSGVE